MQKQEGKKTKQTFKNIMETEVHHEGPAEYYKDGCQVSVVLKLIILTTAKKKH